MWPARSRSVIFIYQVRRWLDREVWPLGVAWNCSFLHVFVLLHIQNVLFPYLVLLSKARSATRHTSLSHASLKQASRIHDISRNFVEISRLEKIDYDFKIGETFSIWIFRFFSLKIRENVEKVCRNLKRLDQMDTYLKIGAVFYAIHFAIFRLELLMIFLIENTWKRRETLWKFKETRSNGFELKNRGKFRLDPFCDISTGILVDFLTESLTHAWHFHLFTTLTWFRFRKNTWKGNENKNSFESQAASREVNRLRGRSSPAACRFLRIAGSRERRDEWPNSEKVVGLFGVKTRQKFEKSQVCQQIKKSPSVFFFLIVPDFFEQHRRGTRHFPRGPSTYKRINFYSARYTFALKNSRESSPSRSFNYIRPAGHGRAIFRDWSREFRCDTRRRFYLRTRMYTFMYVYKSRVMNSRSRKFCRWDVPLTRNVSVLRLSIAFVSCATFYLHLYK